MTLTPAYGRDYRSKKAVLADWEAGKDFIVNNYSGSGTYINKEGAIREKLTKVISFRYNKLTRVCFP